MRNLGPAGPPVHGAVRWLLNHQHTGEQVSKINSITGCKPLR
jgi:hypothetical protein